MDVGDGHAARLALIEIAGDAKGARAFARGHDHRPLTTEIEDGDAARGAFAQEGGAAAERPGDGCGCCEFEREARS
jgi:hypothetical protein